jgi:succinoglycan biosynthesis transport protein ExoP
MKRMRLRGLYDYLALVVRRRWWVAISFIAFSALAVLFSTLFPEIFLSETMILIQPRDVPTDFVKDLIAGTTDQRLSSIEQTVLSRTNLLKILNEFEDRLSGYRGLNDDRKVVKLKKRIKIDFYSERRNGVYLPTTSFRISYRDQNPELAQKITERLASLFIEQDNRARVDQVFGTTDFLTRELNKVADQLIQSEANLKTLKAKYRYQLPSDFETSLRALDRLQQDKTSNLEALDRQLTMQMTLDRLISETPQMITREAKPRPGATGAPARSPLVEKYLKKEEEYNELSIKATAKYPDMQRLRAELDQLKKEIPPEDLAVALQAPPGQQTGITETNPAYQNLTIQLSQMKTEIEISKEKRQAIEANIELYNRRIQNAPGVEQEMAAILRANAELKRRHDGLNEKLEQANLAKSLESNERGGQFLIVDSANYPLEPITPAAWVIILAGLGISLALAVAVAWIVDGLNPRVWTQRQLERLLEMPVLVEIPSLASVSDIIRMRRRKFVHALLLILSGGVYMGGLFYLYLKQSALLRFLDPIIEQLTERITG